jgi:hypothetical protein
MIKVSFTNDKQFNVGEYYKCIISGYTSVVVVVKNLDDTDSGYFEACIIYEPYKYHGVGSIKRLNCKAFDRFYGNIEVIRDV